MAAAAALNVVKQIQALADGPETPEMKHCIGQVVASLQFFVEHPDCRVRVLAARTMLKLKRGYPTEWASLDVSKVHLTQARCVEAIENGSVDGEAEELRSVLDELLGTEKPAAGEQPEAPPTGDADAADAAAQPPDPDPPAPSAGSSAVPDGLRGEVVLKVNEAADAKMKAAILEKVVSIAGVVSVTFEGCYVIVSTRTAVLSADAGFLADLLSAVKAQGVEGASLVSTGSPAHAATEGAAGPSHGTGETVPSGAPAALGGAAPSGDPAYSEVGPPPEDEEAGEPGYLDDEDEHPFGGSGFPAAGAGIPGPSGLGGGYPGGFAAGLGGGVGSGLSGSVGGLGGGVRPGMGGGFGGGLGGGLYGGYPGLGGVAGVGMNPQWSFFSQSQFVNWRRMTQFDDDPSIAARLAKAKQRERERKEEEKSRLGRLFSRFSGGR